MRKVGATLEVRILRDGMIGKVVRLKIGENRPAQTVLCLARGAAPAGALLRVLSGAARPRRPCRRADQALAGRSVDLAISAAYGCPKRPGRPPVWTKIVCSPGLMSPSATAAFSPAIALAV